MSQIADNFGSLPGIVSTTILAVDFMKRSIGSMPYLSKIPTWLYSVLVAGTLTIIANKVLHSLQGDVLDLTWQAVTNAATASGVYGWLNHHDVPLADSADKSGATPPLEIK